MQPGESDMKTFLIIGLIGLTGMGLLGGYGWAAVASGLFLGELIWQSRHPAI
jgi:hypothetical protein